MKDNAGWVKSRDVEADAVPNSHDLFMRVRAVFSTVCWCSVASEAPRVPDRRRVLLAAPVAVIAVITTVALSTLVLLTAFLEIDFLSGPATLRVGSCVT